MVHHALYRRGIAADAAVARSDPLPEAVRLLHDVVEALAYAHSRGVVHRDIKPGNMLRMGQHALVTDFGVAKALNAALPSFGPGHTTSGMAIGTPAYMAPEQLAADPDADQRVDIYAVGLLAYEMLTGASPFSAPSPTATMTAQLTRVPPPLDQVQPDIPPAFSALVQHCLAKNPDDRPRDAEAVLVELDRIAGALAADQHRAVSGESEPRPRASAVPLILGGIATLVLVVGGFWWNQRSNAVATRRADSALARMGSDTSDLSVPLPRMLTRGRTRSTSPTRCAISCSRSTRAIPSVRWSRKGHRIAAPGVAGQAARFAHARAAARTEPAAQAAVAVAPAVTRWYRAPARRLAAEISAASPGHRGGW